LSEATKIAFLKFIRVHFTLIVLNILLKLAVAVHTVWPILHLLNSCLCKLVDFICLFVHIENSLCGPPLGKTRIYSLETLRRSSSQIVLKPIVAREKGRAASIWRKNRRDFFTVFQRHQRHLGINSDTISYYLPYGHGATGPGSALNGLLSTSQLSKSVVHNKNGFLKLTPWILSKTNWHLWIVSHEWLNRHEKN